MSSYMDKSDFGTKKGFDSLAHLFYQQAKIVEKTIEFLFKSLEKKPQERVDTIYFLLFGLITSSKSILMLSYSGKVIECYILARSVVERIIIALYLLICDQDEFDRYKTYSIQKAVRMKNREINIDTIKAVLKASNYEEMLNNQEVQKALGMFTGPKGKKITRWNTKSLKKMLDSIRNGGLDVRYLMLALLAIYDEASEALHGTFYGAMFHSGVFDTGVPKEKKELEKTWISRLSLILFSLSTCIYSLIKGLDNVYPIESLSEESRDLLKNIRE